MLEVRNSSERGYEDKGWLQASYSFSFDTYYDPDFQGFRQLRAINENCVKGGKGFGFHLHKDMDILTYVLEGVIEQQDSVGHTTLIRPGEIQYMSCGGGITHKEMNLSHHTPARFLQFWVMPENPNLPPGTTQRLFSDASKWGQWCLLASHNGRDGSLRLHQNLELYSILLDANDASSFQTMPERYYWVQIVSGKFMIQETILSSGDGVSIFDEDLLEFHCLEPGELLLFDLS